MICPNCKATVRPQAAAGYPASPQVFDARAQQGARVAEMRVPIAEGGRKYVGLTTAARMLIRYASLVRILSIIVSLLVVVSTMLTLSNSDAPPAAYLFAGVWGIAIALFGWMLSLMLTIFGELMYVVVDIEENLRRHT